VDLVIADPPFLSEECLSKAAETMRLLSRAGKLVLCTGARRRLQDACIPMPTALTHPTQD
jgi:hypothetical protein